MASWYLYSDDGQHLGPVPTEYVARAVKSGAVPLDRWVTEADRTQWRRIQDIPEICSLVQAMNAPRVRDRETTMIASADAFPIFAGIGAPATRKEAPSSDDRGAESSERTLIAPAAFELEMAEIDARDAAESPGHGARRPAAGMPAGSGGQGAFPPVAAGYEFRDESTLRSESTPHDPFGSTLRSPDSPPEIVGRPVPPVVERTSGAPAVPAQVAAAQGFVPGPVARSEPPARRGRTGPVIVFFLGGLALGAIVVVAMLVWAFRGGLLSR